MHYSILTAFIVCLVHSHFSRVSGYNCTKFGGLNHYHPLVECPPANFMLKDNLVECFDNFTSFHNGPNLEYMCMSRRDMDEEIIKNTTVTTAYIHNELNDLIFEPFSTKYQFNGTHFKCDSEEKWAGSWFNIDADSTSPCTTNTTISVNVKYHSDDNNL